MADSPDSPQPSPVDAADLARLLMEHRAALYGYILACVRHHADAEDILQDVSVAATRSIGQLRSREGFFPWAREIARRRVLEHFRKTQHLSPMDPELVERLAEAADRLEQKDSTQASERQAALHACLDQLPPESRQMIAMRYDRAAARSVEDIARRFGRSVQATYALLKRIRMVLRDCVERKLNGAGGEPEAAL